MIVLNKIQVDAIESATQALKCSVSKAEHELSSGIVKSFPKLEEVLSLEKSKLAVLEDLIEQFNNENGD